ncbi:MAG: response regulator transcription factor [Akkermansiaceae bacterium]|nr:response regulator transcription factor [Armatimonadota bacterium]
MCHEMITILLVDDHELVRRGIRAFLESKPGLVFVGEAETGEVALTMAQEHAPDVVLLDLLLPGMDGVETTRRIKAVSPRSQVVILTSYHENEHILPALQAGAISYLLKDVGPSALEDAVRRAVRGEAVLHPKVATKVMRSLSSRGQYSRTRQQGPLGPELTSREAEVLRHIASGLPNAEIATKLFVTEKTVKSHVSNILNKLHLSDRTQAAVYAWREGIMRKESG